MGHLIYLVHALTNSVLTLEHEGSCPRGPECAQEEYYCYLYGGIVGTSNQVKLIIHQTPIPYLISSQLLSNSNGAPCRNAGFELCGDGEKNYHSMFSNS